MGVLVGGVEFLGYEFVVTVVSFLEFIGYEFVGFEFIGDELEAPLKLETS